MIRECFWGNSELDNDQWEGMTKLRRELQGGIGFADGRLLIAGYLEAHLAKRLRKEGLGFAELLAGESLQKGVGRRGVFLRCLFVGGWMFLWMGGWRKMRRTSVSIGRLCLHLAPMDEQVTPRSCC